MLRPGRIDYVIPSTLVEVVIAAGASRRRPFALKQENGHNAELSINVPLLRKPYFLKAAVQFSTIVNGSLAVWSGALTTRNRCPSADTSY